MKFHLRFFLKLFLIFIVTGCTSGTKISASGEKYTVSVSGNSGATNDVWTIALSAQDGSSLSADSHYIDVIFKPKSGEGEMVSASDIRPGDNDGEYKVKVSLPNPGAYEAMIIVMKGHPEEVITLDYLAN